MLGEMVESCAPSGCRACSVCSPCTCQMLGCIVLPSTLELSFHTALVFLRVSAASVSRCILTHRKTHAWSENASKNSKQRREGIIIFCTPSSGGRPMLPGNTLLQRRTLFFPPKSSNNRASLVCSSVALCAFASRVLLRNPIGSVGVDRTTTLLDTRALSKNCNCVHLICWRSLASPPPA